MGTADAIPVIGLDVGSSRTGIARADVSMTLASPLAVIDTEPLNSLSERLAAAIQQPLPRCIVVGLPLDQRGNESTVSGMVRDVCSWISKTADVEILFLDERFTTQEVLARRAETGLKARHSKSDIDAWAAASILQAYLDSSRQTPYVD